MPVWEVPLHGLRRLTLEAKHARESDGFRESRINRHFDTTELCRIQFGANCPCQCNHVAAGVGGQQGPGIGNARPFRRKTIGRQHVVTIQEGPATAWRYASALHGKLLRLGGLHVDGAKVTRLQRDNPHRPSCTTICGMMASTVMGMGRSLTISTEACLS